MPAFLAEQWSLNVWILQPVSILQLDHYMYSYLLAFWTEFMQMPSFFTCSLNCHRLYIPSYLILVLSPCTFIIPSKSYPFKICPSQTLSYFQLPHLITSLGPQSIYHIPFKNSQYFITCFLFIQDDSVALVTIGLTATRKFFIFVILQIALLFIRFYIWPCLNSLIYLMTHFIIFTCKSIWYMNIEIVLNLCCQISSAS